jgi:transcription elongation factor GreB
MLGRMSPRHPRPRAPRAGARREDDDSDPAKPARRAAYITPEGAKRLRAEFDELWRVERPRVTQQVADAAALGDRSENAEYIYGKKRLREIDRRVRFLSKRLEQIRIVTEPPTDPRRVFFGAWVTVEDEDGELHCHRIVGPDEFDREPGFISMDAPLARALLGKALDATVRIETPAGTREYVIAAISYGSRPPLTG